MAAVASGGADEEPEHEVPVCTGDANGQNLGITPLAAPFGVAAPWRQVAGAGGCALCQGRREPQRGDSHLADTAAEVLLSVRHSCHCGCGGAPSSTTADTGETPVSRS